MLLHVCVCVCTSEAESLCATLAVCVRISVYMRVCVFAVVVCLPTPPQFWNRHQPHTLWCMCVCVCVCVVSWCCGHSRWQDVLVFLSRILPAAACTHTHTHKFMHTHTSINTHKYTHTHLLLVTSPYWPVSSPLVSLFSLMSSTFGQEVTSLSEFLCPDFTLLSVT